MVPSESLPNSLNTSLSNFVRIMSQLLSIMNFFASQSSKKRTTPTHKSRWAAFLISHAIPCNITYYFLRQGVEYNICSKQR